MEVQAMETRTRRRPQARRLPLDPLPTPPKPAPGRVEDQRDTPPAPPPTPVARPTHAYYGYIGTFGTIELVACKILGVTREDVRSKCRHPLVVTAREIITALARKNTALSYPAINERLRGRRGGHSTTITAHERYKRKLTGRGVTRSMLAGRESYEALVDEIAEKAMVKR